MPLFGKKEVWYIAYKYNGVPAVLRVDDARNAQEAMKKGYEKLSGVLFMPFSMDGKNDVAAQKQAYVMMSDSALSEMEVLGREPEKKEDPLKRMSSHFGRL
jgi:hypothetical protein